MSSALPGEGEFGIQQPTIKLQLHFTEYCPPGECKVQYCVRIGEHGPTISGAPGEGSVPPSGAAEPTSPQHSTSRQTYTNRHEHAPRGSVLGVLDWQGKSVLVNGKVLDG